MSEFISDAVHERYKDVIGREGASGLAQMNALAILVAQELGIRFHRLTYDDILQTMEGFQADNPERSPWPANEDDIDEYTKRFAAKLEQGGTDE